MAEAHNFESLVHEAFITPLRSVLIVDDQYPTWEEIFSSRITANQHHGKEETSSVNKSWLQNPESAGEILGLIKEFRNQNPGFIIDIHDGASGDESEVKAGSESPQQLADHLHQSDLLVLDYYLEGSESGAGGKTARKILASVLDNHHFNLVAIHTSEDLLQSIHECLISLMSSCTSKFDSELNEKIDALDDLISEKEDSGEFDRSHIKDKLEMDAYLQSRDSDGNLSRSSRMAFIKGDGAFAQLHAWASELALEEKIMPVFLYWAIRSFEKPLLRDFSATSYKGLSWNISDAHKWLRTSRGFVCFVKKGPENLLAELKGALIDWKPTPSRLLSAKYRYEISRIGAEVEDSSLRRRHAFAKFYETIRKPGKEELLEDQLGVLRRHKLKDHVSRQSEMLSFLVEENIADFGQKIYDADEACGFQFQSHYGVDLAAKDENKTAISEYNRYVCCLPSRESVSAEKISEQLDSGHIFKFDDTWWVCATPACDLQPGQNVIAFEKGEDSSLRPFTAMELHRVQNLDDLTDRHVNSGSYCYVEYNGNILGLGTKNPKKDTSEPADQKVHWRSFVAKNGGLIVDGKLELLEIKLELDELKIKSNVRFAEVIAKLRYEYALNYIQRVGASVSRIGLGYVSPPELKKK